MARVKIKTVEALYEKGYLRPLEPLEQRPGLAYFVTIVDVATIENQESMAKSLRGKYSGHLTSSEEFSRQKTIEKALER